MSLLSSGTSRSRSPNVQIVHFIFTFFFFFSRPRIDTIPAAAGEISHGIVQILRYKASTYRNHLHIAYYPSRNFHTEFTVLPKGSGVRENKLYIYNTASTSLFVKLISVTSQFSIPALR